MHHLQRPEWYTSSISKVQGEKSAAALKKGLEIMESTSAPEPVVFIHEDMCEFKWSNSVIYVFGDERKTIYIQHNGHEFVESCLSELTFT